jgi:hypothetical protein
MVCDLPTIKIRTRLKNASTSSCALQSDTGAEFICYIKCTETSPEVCAVDVVGNLVI